ncbi:hypothetical protein DPMN_067382 [Dreissena polymorpha]|uniref:Glycosyl hydrolases family 39 N-terminal catalytic domain-containing protein n=1 Tax=Dreissena polymorpha TaxID=45954 RepID=A0A9D3YZI1_DREPO|nr:hypothetical protein DPMN_067382 [Dreissena polymorpha]
MKMRILIVVCLFLTVLTDLVAGMQIHVRTSGTVGPLRHFWKSTGFRKYHEPYSGKTGLNACSLPPLKPPVYNFTSLDSLIDLLYANGLKPGFELMGNPSGLFKDFEDKTSLMIEADPLVGWSQDEEWRADSTYAAIVAKLLSNDNAFLSWSPYQYTQRTLLARFQMNNTSPPHTHFFQKPVYNGMELLSLLGEIEVQSKITYTNGEDLNTPLGVLASTHTPVTNHTADSWQTTVLMYMSNDTGPQTDKAYVYLSIDIEPPRWASQELHMVGWWLDNTLGNSYKLWDEAGRPPYPTLELQHQMRTISNSPPIFNQPVQPGNQFIGKFFIQEPSIVVVHVCSKPDAPPD